MLSFCGKKEQVKQQVKSFLESYKEFDDPTKKLYENVQKIKIIIKQGHILQALAPFKISAHLQKNKEFLAELNAIALAIFE